MSKKIKINELKPDSRNHNKHTKDGMALLEKSVEKVGIIESITISNDNEIISGNARHEVIGRKFESEPIIIETDGTRPVILKRTDIESGTKEFYEASILANTTAKKNIDFDIEVIDALVEEFDIDVVDLGVDIVDYSDGENEITSEIEDKEIKAIEKLEDKFIVPPFSILNAREGKWQERKKAWRKLILDTGEARDHVEANNNNNWEGKEYGGEGLNNVSILDPVLSEIIIKWFGLEKSNIIDCFAGDTVFGYVSTYLNNNFTGIELRQEQVDFNNKNGLNAKYICDDGRNILHHIDENSQDLLFSCPPYFDLEVYSDLSNDASNQKEYKEFIQILDTAFSNSIRCLKNNRFAVVVCGDVRDKKGNYYRFPDHIKEIFERNNMPLYNELILIDPVGNLQLRVGKYMEHRKVGKTHQNVLVFFKGNPKEIKNIFPKIEIKVDESTDV